MCEKAFVAKSNTFLYFYRKSQYTLHIYRKTQCAFVCLWQIPMYFYISILKPNTLFIWTIKNKFSFHRWKILAPKSKNSTWDLINGHNKIKNLRRLSNLLHWYRQYPQNSQQMVISVCYQYDNTNFFHSFPVTP